MKSPVPPRARPVSVHVQIAIGGGADRPTLEERLPDILPTPDGKLTYEQWVRYIFDRDSAQWYWEKFLDLGNEWGEPLEKHWYRRDSTVLCEYLTRLFREPDAVSVKYSRDQIASATWFIFGSSAWMTVRLEPSVPESARVELVDSIHHVYRRLYAPLCAGLERVEINKDPLAIACYMIWDMDCLWPPKEPELAGIKEAQYRVLEQSLTIRSDVVRRSALHGLGDTHYRADPERVAAIIDRFLIANAELPGFIFDYAIDARTGNVQ